jgi:hypothetical protein
VCAVLRLSFVVLKSMGCSWLVDPLWRVVEGKSLLACRTPSCLTRGAGKRVRGTTLLSISWILTAMTVAKSIRRRCNGDCDLS